MFADVRYARMAFGLACLLPALLLFGVVATLWVNAPLPDDIDAILDFANRSAAAGSTWERVRLLFEPHVDHRIVTTRATALLQLGLCGQLDLRVLAAVGVAGLLSLGWLLPRLGTDSRTDPIPASAPLTWLLFQPQAYDALLSPTMGANLLVLPFALGVLLALRRATTSGFAVAVLCAALAMFTQGNGVLVLPAALLALTLARRRAAALGWLGVCLALGFVALGGATTSREQPLSLASGDAGGAIAYALAFLGSAPGLGSLPISVAVGVGVIGFAVFCARGGAARRNPWLWGALAFVLLSAAANALGRSGLGAEYAVSQPRYRAYSLLALALCHLIGFERWGRRGKRRHAALALGIAIGFAAVSYARYAPEGRAMAGRAAQRLARFAVTGVWNAHPRPEHAQAVLAGSRSLGIFTADPGSLARHLDQVVSRALPEATQQLSAVLTRDQSGGGFRLLEGRFDGTGLDREKLRAFVVLHGGTRIVGARVLRPRQPADPTERERGVLRFRSLVPAAVLAELQGGEVVGLLVSDGVYEGYAQSIGRAR